MELVAVIPVRDGALPQGGAETVAECAGHAVLAGPDAAQAVGELAGIARDVVVVEVTSVGPAALAAMLAPLVAGAGVVVLPASPDGRDLAPRLAQRLGRPLLAGAVRVHERGADLARWGGLVEEETTADGPFVATLQPGVRGVEPDPSLAAPAVRVVTVDGAGPAAGVVDAETLEVLPPDVATMDLGEAPRIVGGGAGLAGAERFAQLEQIATALGASMGATRVVTDRGWVSHERQIGTTGVVVDPRLYLAFGISGAVQHTSGLGAPAHIVSVNTDATCPMMQLADLAIVADANAVLDELAALLLPPGVPVEVPAERT
jgi:electron transfer flavoprotein alpha subunit